MAMDVQLLDIGEVSWRTGLAPSALRFYEAQGLIASRARKGLRRQYDNAALERLAAIALFRKAGFSLDEVKQLLATGGSPAWKELARAKHAELVQQIERLALMRARLEHALDCPAPNLLECPHFRRALATVWDNTG